MAEPLKNQFFTPQFVDDLCAALVQVDATFDAPAFQAQVYADGWDDYTLMQRMRHITACLGASLPGDYRAVLDRLTRASFLLDAYGFDRLIFPEYVALYGLDDWDASLPALKTFTPQCSSEFAVRPFILQDPPRMMVQMLDWAGDTDPHVRRLASEGCRPRLPWALALPLFKADPAPILPVLERLKTDESEYVRRSVANNFNDIAKDNPQVVIDVLREWRQIGSPHTDWIINHALRTLVKAGDPQALDILGFNHDAAVQVHSLTVEPAQVAMGAAISFRFTVEATGTPAQDFIIDYVLHFARANGKSSRKVFKLTRRTMQPGETLTLEKSFSFAPINTRRYYPGPHRIEVQVNGRVRAGAGFEVITGGDVGNTQ